MQDCSVRFVLATWHMHTYEDNDVRTSAPEADGIAPTTLATAPPRTPLPKTDMAAYAVVSGTRAASIRLRATCRLLRPANDEVATASLSFARSTSASDAERMIST